MTKLRLNLTFKLVFKFHASGSDLRPQRSYQGSIAALIARLNVSLRPCTRQPGGAGPACFANQWRLHSPACCASSVCS